MTPLNYLLIVAASLAAVYGIFRLVRAYRVPHIPGNQLVSCPETHRPAAVRLAAGTAALETIVRRPATPSARVLAFGRNAKTARKIAWRKLRRRPRPAWSGRSVTAGMQDKSARIATSRSGQSIGTITRLLC